MKNHTQAGLGQGSAATGASGGRRVALVLVQNREKGATFCEPTSPVWTEQFRDLLLRMGSLDQQLQRHREAR